MNLAGTLGVILLLAGWGLGSRKRVAIGFGLLLPIEFIDGVSPSLLDVARLAFAVWLLVAWRDEIDRDLVRVVRPLTGTLAVLAVFRIGMSVLNHDPGSRYLGFTMLATLVVAVPVSLVRSAHRHVLTGFLIGVTASAAESILQSMDVLVLRTPDLGPERFPGFSTYTMLLTWQLAAALVLAAMFMVMEDRFSARWLVGAVAIPLCAVALMTNGAQGGFLGLAAAAGAVVVWGRRVAVERTRQLLGGRLWIAVAAGLVLVAGVGGFLAVSKVSLPSLSGLVGKEGYHNETTRFEVAAAGWQEMVAHPITGMGRTQFIAEQTIGPHFLPLEAGASAGVVGFVLGSAVLVLLARFLWRPATSDLYVLTGVMIVAMGLAQSLTDPARPFVGAVNLTVLLIAVVATVDDRREIRSVASRRAEAPSRQGSSVAGATDLVD